MSMNDMSLREFTSVLASKASVPGGGGASALVGAIGTALGSMVGSLTVGKKKYADVEDDIRALMVKAEELQNELLDAIDGDAAAFEPLSKAYGIPKDDPGRGEIMEKCLKDAAAVPMKILRLCCRAIELHEEFAEKGSVLVISDAGTGAVLCWGAMYGAALNVKVNTKSMTDREYADSMNAEVDKLMDEYYRRAEAVYEKVMRRFS